MILVPLGVVFVGYTVTYYGFTLLKGPGVGFLDLLIPSRWSKADAQIKALSGVKKPPGLNPE